MTRRTLLLTFVAFFSYLTFLFPPPAILILTLAIFSPAATSLIASFVLGLFLDIVTGQTLGVRSVYYLLLSMITILYRGKLSPSHIWYVSIVSLFSGGVEYLLIERAFFPILIGLSPVVSLFYQFLLKKEQRHVLGV